VPASTSHSAADGTSASVSQLARAELQIVFHTLFRRVPTWNSPCDRRLPLKHDRLAYGVYELPVTW